MNLIKLYLRSLNIIPFFLFLPILIWGLNTENLQSRIPGIFYVYIVLAYVLSIRIFVIRDRLLIKRRILYHFGAMSKFNALIVFLFLIGMLAIFFSVYFYDSRVGVNPMILIGMVMLFQGISQIKKYYLKVNKKVIDKFDFEPILIKDVTEIECLEDKAIVKTEKRKLEVFYNYLHEGEKEQLLEVLEKIQQNKSIEII